MAYPLWRRALSAVYTLDRFAAELRQIRQFAGSTDLLSRVMDYFRPSREDTLDRVERIIAAMTTAERDDPTLIGSVERTRIAQACGVDVGEIERFFAGFARLSEQMRELARKSLFRRLWMAIPWVVAVALVIARMAGW